MSDDGTRWTRLAPDFYDAYAASKRLSGYPMLHYEELSPSDQLAWKAVALWVGKVARTMTAETVTKTMEMIGDVLKRNT